MPRLALVAALGALPLAAAACDRSGASSDSARSSPIHGQGASNAARTAYDADSAARGLLTPELAALLAVEPLLARASDTSATDGRRCKQDTLAQLLHVKLRFDVSAGDTVTTIFARRTPQGELRRAEVLRRLPDRSALGASWDASERATTVQEFSGGTVKKTTSRDDDAPLAHALRYVGRRTLGTKCGG